MEPPIPTGVPRPGYSTQNYNPNFQRPPNTLPDNMQNLYISRPTGPPSGPPTGQPSGPPTGAPLGPPSGLPVPSFPRSSHFASSPHMSSAPLANPLGPTSIPPSAPPSSYPGASLGSRPGPPPSSFPRAPPSVTAPPQSITQPSLASGRQSGPPFSQPPPPGPRPFSSAFSSAPMTSGPTSPPSTVHAPLTNGPPLLGRGNMPGAPSFSFGNNQQPPVGPPTGVGPRGPMGQTMRPFPGSPVSSPPMGHTTQPPPPFSTAGQGMFPPTYGSQMGQMQPTLQGPPPNQGGMPPRMYGMPPPLPGQSMPMGSPAMSHMPVSGGLSTGPSKIDPNQIPRPFPSSSATIYETRQGGQANIPPPATSEYVVKDTGNCSPRYMRCTINQIPCTVDLLSTSSMQLALVVQPFALPHPSEEQIQLVDFGEGGPVRCSRCKGYINPFMKFIDQGRRFICNLCGFSDETPRDYHSNLGPDGRRRDADQRPELCRGTVEFVATKEFMVRDPMPAVFFFLVDVSMNAIQTGATAAACNAISQAIADLPEGPRTMVGFATFDSTIHFYNLKRILQQPLMLIVPDIQDVYTPLQTDVIVPLAECRQHLEQLLDSIPSMFQSNKVADSAFGAATKAAFLAMKNTGGKLLVFQSVLPSVGFGALSARESEGRTNVSSGEKEVQKLLQPADKTLKTMAIEFAEYQVCVDIFLTSQTYVDIASVSVVPNTTGGQVYYYYPFSALSDSAKLYNDLKWNVTRPQGFEAVMRVRCSQGLQVQEYSGSFCKRIPTDVDLPAIDCDKTIMVTFKHDDKLVEGTECAFQCALLYTTVFGERRIRVSTLSLPCTSVLSNLFRAADLDAQFSYFAKLVANEVPTKPLVQIREQVISQCVNILTAYRKFCATVSSSGQLILPEALKLLPLYTLALVKSMGLRTDSRVDDQAYWISHVISLAVPLTVPLVYPRLMAIHKLVSEEESEFPPVLPLSSEHLEEDGVYLLENGEDGLIYVGKGANVDVLQQIFGVPSIDKIPTQFILQQFENGLSRKLNDLVNEIRSQRCSYLRLRLCKKGDISENLFFSYMVEDKSPASASYVEFLVHIHRQIQAKMA